MIFTGPPPRENITFVVCPHCRNLVTVRVDLDGGVHDVTARPRYPADDDL